MINVQVFDLTNNRVGYEPHINSLVKGVIYEHETSHRRIAVIDPDGHSTTSNPTEASSCHSSTLVMGEVGGWHPTGHKLNIVGVTFHGNPKIYSYFCSSEHPVRVGDSITIDAPSGKSTVNVEFVRPIQGLTTATKLLPIVYNRVPRPSTIINYYNFKVIFINVNGNGLSKKEYFYSVKVDNLPEQIKSEHVGYAVLVENKELVYYKLEDCGYTAKYGIKTFEEITVATYNTCNLKTKFQNHTKADLIKFRDCMRRMGKFKSAYDKDRFLSLVNGLIIDCKNDNEIKEEKENETMNMNKIFGNMEFGKINTSAIKYSVAGLAFRSVDGSYLTYDLEKMEATNVADMVFDMDSVFAMPIAAKDIKRGDIVKHQGIFVIIKHKYEDGTIAAIDPVNSTEVTIIPVKNVFGFNYVTKVFNVFEGMAPNGDNPFGDMSKMLPMMMCMGEKGNNDMFSMFAMMSMCGGDCKDMMSNPLMMYALMKGDM